MGVTWDDVAEAMRALATYVREAGLWYSVADSRPVTEDFIAGIRSEIESAYGRGRSRREDRI